MIVVTTVISYREAEEGEEEDEEDLKCLEQ